MIHAYILVLDVLKQLELAVRALGKYRRRKGFHDLLDRDSSCRQLVLGRAIIGWLEYSTVMRYVTCQTRPNAPVPSQYVRLGQREQSLTHSNGLQIHISGRNLRSRLQNSQICSMTTNLEGRAENAELDKRHGGRRERVAYFLKTS
jgi:hypothetical protein